jgi:hypothetical protein
MAGLVALAAMLGGVAVPAVATASPAAATRPGVTARPAAVGGAVNGTPMISCVLTTDCLGIEGTSSQNDGAASTPTRVARWNGSAWRGIGVTMPKGTKSADLLGVSCKGAKSCLVVGDYYTSTSENATAHMLALSYNGTSLKPTTTVPLPKGVTGVALISVSCATTRYCVALGANDSDTSAFGDAGSSFDIVETWNGAKWTLHTPAASIGKTTVALASGVSCATSTFCVVTGASYSENTPGFATNLYFASWNGKKLTTMKLAAAGSSADVVEPLGISCATPSSCAVTGVNFGSASSGGTTSAASFTEIWNGKSWQLAKVTWPKGAAESVLAGVSCYAAHACEAVGADGANLDSSFRAAAVSYQGTAGAVQPVPVPPKGHSAVFDDVSCLPWGSCVAVGETGKSTASSGAVMTGVWNGKAWKLGPGF